MENEAHHSIRVTWSTIEKLVLGLILMVTGYTAKLITGLDTRVTVLEFAVGIGKHKYSLLGHKPTQPMRADPTLLKFLIPKPPEERKTEDEDSMQ